MATSNGYANEATKALLLFLKNDREWYFRLRAMAAPYKFLVEDLEDREGPVIDFARALHLLFDTTVSRRHEPDDIDTILLQTAIDCINWEEIADDFID